MAFMKKAEMEAAYRHFSQEYDVHLNPQQEAAVMAVSGKHLLLANPGTGKTTVLVDRAGFMVKELGISPESILCVTFTDAAASEMRKRFNKKYGCGEELNVDFRTLNSLAVSIYKTYATYKNQTMFGHATEADTRKILTELYIRYNDEFPAECDMVNMRSCISNIKNRQIPPDQIYGRYNKLVPHIYNIYTEYNAELKRQRKLDFDDQLVYAAWLLSNKALKEHVLDVFKEKYQYICVDEAQDTSYIQHKIIYMLAQKNNLFMVGDEDQSIYGFRAAEPEELLKFKETYPEGKIMLMERNYRSTPEIVNLAQGFIERNTGRYEKHMTAERGHGADVEFIDCEGREDQFNRVISIAKSQPADTAFLYRDNETSVVLVDIMDRLGIPFNLKAPKFRFFDGGVVRDMVNNLRLIVNPYDYETFGYACNHGILWMKKPIKEKVLEICSSRKCSFIEGMREAYSKYFVSEYNRMQNMIATWNKIAIGSNPLEAIDSIMNSGFSRYIQMNNYDSAKISLLRMIAKREGTIQSLLQRIDYLSDKMQGGIEMKDGVELSTIHSAKGKEYGTVYLIDIYDGRFPAAVPGDTATKNQNNAYQEERRLFYVGMTRAKDKLYLMDTGMPSTFLNEADDILRRVKR